MQTDNVAVAPPTYDANLFIPLPIVTAIVPGLRHNNAMRAVTALAALPGFGHVTTIEYTVDSNTLAERTYPTYLLSKRQSFIYAADASPTVLRYLSEYWQKHDDNTGRTPHALACLNSEFNHYYRVAAEYEAAYNTLRDTGVYTEVNPFVKYDARYNPKRSVERIQLKELTDKLKIRHNDAMHTVDRLMADSDKAFGEVELTTYKTSRGNTYQTYLLDYTQSLMVIAKLNFMILCHFVDFWLDREATHLTPVEALQKLQHDITTQQKYAYHWQLKYNAACEYGFDAD